MTNGNLIVAETVAREFEKLPLDYALALVRLYGDKGDRRYEPAALRYLERLHRGGAPGPYRRLGHNRRLARRTQTGLTSLRPWRERKGRCGRLERDRNGGKQAVAVRGVRLFE